MPVLRFSRFALIAGRDACAPSVRRSQRNALPAQCAPAHARAKATQSRVIASETGAPASQQNCNEAQAFAKGGRTNSLGCFVAKSLACRDTQVFAKSREGNSH